MLIAFILILVANIISSVWVYKQEKQNTDWLNKAQKAYEEDKKTLFYPKSEIALRKKYMDYASIQTRTMIGAWLILLIVPFFFDVKVLIILYLLNYCYGQILYSLAVINSKIDVINEHIFKEDEF
jgi:hypothetical protein